MPLRFSGIHLGGIEVISCGVINEDETIQKKGKTIQNAAKIMIKYLKKFFYNSFAFTIHNLRFLLFLNALKTKILAIKIIQNRINAPADALPILRDWKAVSYTYQDTVITLLAGAFIPIMYGKSNTCQAPIIPVAVKNNKIGLKSGKVMLQIF